MRRFGWLFGISLSMALGLASACKENHDGGDTQTNWLKSCTSSDECGAFECLCGRCTQSCQTDADCEVTPVSTTCQAASSQAAQTFCGGEAPLSGICIETPAATPSDSTAATDVADFCQRFVQTYCEYTASCGCGAAAADQCRTNLASTCQPGGLFDGLGAAAAAGEIKYDAAAADALLARLNDPEAPCVEEPFRNLRLTSDELYSWAGTFTGTKALGDACSLPVNYKGGFSDCAEGACAPADATSGTCIALVGLGEACDASGDHNFKATTAHLCFDHRPSDSDGEYESAFDSLSCVPGATGASVCARGLANDQPCNDDEACSSGRCQSTGVQMGVCAELLADGEPCSYGGDCLSGSCPANPSGTVCEPPRADGEPCSLGAECASGGCYGSPGSQVCAVPLARAIGEACGSDADCTTQVCRMGTCWADICGDYLDP
jgi:hypothetical protein